MRSERLTSTAVAHAAGRAITGIRWPRVLTAIGWLAAALAGIVLVDAVAPRGLPFGIVLLGILIGSLNGLVALGLVLIYRAGKYVNFAQGGIGAAGAVITGKLVIVNHLPYALAVLIGLIASVLFAGLVEVLFVQRLFKAPRLILTVATIGMAQLFGAFEFGVNAFWNTDETLLPTLEFPIDFEFVVSGVLFRAEHVVVLVVFPIVLAGLFGFFRFTSFGAAVQAAAENSDRARLLGISVRRISTIVWMVAGLLAGITAILQAPIVGFTFGAAAGPSLLLRALAPAMLAGLRSLGGTVVAALGLGVLEQAIAWNTNSSGPIDVALLVVILAALLVQRRRITRTTEGEESSFAAATRIRPFPRELARLHTVRLGRLVGRGALVAAAIVVPLFLSISQQNLAAVLVVYMIAALSLTVLSGFAGQISFGHWAFVGFGALFGGWLVETLDLNFLLAGLVVCLAGVGLSLAIGVPALRIRGLFLAVATLAFAVAAGTYLFTLPIFRATTVASRPIAFGFSFGSELRYYYLCLVFLLLTIQVVRNIRGGRWGRNFIGVRDNDRAAGSYGVGATSSKLIAFAASGFFASLAGYLYVFTQRVPLTAGAFPVETSLLLFAAVVIGGLGSIPGAIIGAMYLRGIQFFVPALQLLSTSFGLLLVLMFAPGGLGGLAFQGRDALLRRLANRWDILVPSLVADRRVEEVGIADADRQSDAVEAAVSEGAPA